MIDGFAGPGEYSKGEQGSPVIALETYLHHQNLSHVDAEVVFVFIEKDKRRFDHLGMVLDKTCSNLPANCVVKRIHGVFDLELTNILDLVEEQNRKLAPSFVMVDPFGVSDTPVAVLERILCNPRCEVFVTFMYEYINRFKVTEEFESHLDALFGCRDWREGIEISDTIARKNFYYDMYERQLKKAGAKYVVKFELYKGNKPIYAIFFGTGNSLGCDKIKQAIWKIAPFGDYCFRGAKGQVEITPEPNTDLLKENLQKKYQGAGFISIDEVLDYVASDATDFCTTHVKTRTLQPMEKSRPPQVAVDESSRKQRYRYPAGTRLKFL